MGRPVGVSFGRTKPKPRLLRAGPAFGFWFVSGLAMGEGCVWVGWNVLADLDIEAFEEALSMLVQRHIVLRTVFQSSAGTGEPARVVQAQGFVDFEVVPPQVEVSAQ